MSDLKTGETEDRRLRVLAVVESKIEPGPETFDSESSTKQRFVWPDLVFKEFLAAVAVMVLLIVWSLLIDAPLLAEADASWTENPAKAPWYFLGLQELLVYFDPWLAGVVLPTLIAAGLIIIPYLDIDNPVSGEYRLSERKKTAAIFLFGAFLWFALIIIGVFFRGPSWHFYWPWESWTIVKHPDQTAHSFSAFSGLVFLGIYFIGGFAVLFALTGGFSPAKDIGFKIRHSIIAVLLLGMAFIPIKIVLRLFFDIQYILITPYLNI